MLFASEKQVSPIQTRYFSTKSPTVLKTIWSGQMLHLQLYVDRKLLDYVHQYNWHGPMVFFNKLLSLSLSLILWRCVFEYYIYNVCVYWVTSRVFHWGTLQQQLQFTFIFPLRFAGSAPKAGRWQPEASDAEPVFSLLPVPGKLDWQIPSRSRWKRTGACSTCFSTATSTTSSSPTRSTTTTTKDENSFQNYEEISVTGKR